MKTPVTLLLLFVCIYLNAQWVEIPGQKFGTWLNANGYSSCVRHGSTFYWELDTTCAEVLSAKSITFNFTLPNYDEDLTGIEYFRNMDSIIFAYNHLTVLPVLPPALKYFQTHSTQLVELAPLPQGLKTLVCYAPSATIPTLPAELKHLDVADNLLDSLPTLPHSLEYLECSNNKLTSLPTLPPFLKILNCHDNLLASLPALPGGLQSLYCCYNHQISELPALPNSLKLLKANYLNLTTVPTLPDSLITFDPDHNNITTLPAIPATVQVLQINNNPITTLPALPDGLIWFDADSCQLTSIPVVPVTVRVLTAKANHLHFIADLPDSMNVFNCTNNPDLTCLPRFNKINYFYFDTAISCLPGYGQVLFSMPDMAPYPICDSASYAACRNITGVKSIEYNNVTEVYPNPFSNVVQLALPHSYNGPVTVSVINMLGQTVFKQTDNTALSVKTIEPGNIPPGVYLLEIIADGERTVKQLIKQ